MFLRHGGAALSKMLFSCVEISEALKLKKTKYVYTINFNYNNKITLKHMNFYLDEIKIVRLGFDLLFISNADTPGDDELKKIRIARPSPTNNNMRIIKNTSQPCARVCCRLWPFLFPFHTRPIGLGLYSNEYNTDNRIAILTSLIIML